MFLSLFLNKSINSFHYDVYEFSRNHHATFALSSNKSIEPFDLIHSNVWGPAPISNISGTKWFISFIDDCTHVTWLFLMKENFEVF